MHAKGDLLPWKHQLAQPACAGEGGHRETRGERKSVATCHLHQSA